jgi:hypothetical protein
MILAVQIGRYWLAFWQTKQRRAVGMQRRRIEHMAPFAQCLSWQRPQFCPCQRMPCI